MKNVSFASTKEVRKRMQAVKQKDTPCELKIRKILHQNGYRYRINSRPLKELNRRADIVFFRLKVAVFIDGCFWHNCPEHGSIPITNKEFWENKFEKTRTRDIETNNLLKKNGWKVFRVWEHENPQSAADRIMEILFNKKAKSTLH